MATTIDTTSRDGKIKGAITVETLDDGTIGLGFIREGTGAQAIRLPRQIATLLRNALTAELQGDA